MMVLSDIGSPLPMLPHNTFLTTRTIWRCGCHESEPTFMILRCSPELDFPTTLARGACRFGIYTFQTPLEAHRQQLPTKIWSSSSGQVIVFFWNNCPLSMSMQHCVLIAPTLSLKTLTGFASGSGLPNSSQAIGKPPISFGAI